MKDVIIFFKDVMPEYGANVHRFQDCLSVIVGVTNTDILFKFNSTTLVNDKIAHIQIILKGE